MPNDKSCRIAELACGHGSFLHWLTICGFDNTVGIDLSEEQTEIASQISPEVLTQDAIEWLENQPNESLDVIFGIDFVEHISKDDFTTMLHHAGRALKPNGRLILRLPNGQSPLVGLNLFNDITHVWTYTPNCLATLGHMHGLTRSKFEDEDFASIRDHRWLKVPLCRIATGILDLMMLCAAKIRIR